VLNPRLADLPDYAFPRLRALLAGVMPGGETVDMTIGEPRHGAPAFIADILAREAALYGKYPPIGGSAEWGQAVADWLTRRYGLPAGMVMADAHVLPLNGSREGLFSAIFVAVPPTDGGLTPVVLLPNPFYQCYVGAAVAAGAEPIYVNATRDTGFLPDFLAQPKDILDRVRAIYLCSPSNPQGAVADAAYLERLIAFVRERDAVLLADECYAEIYDQTPPVGALEVCARLTATGNDADPFRNVLVFHPLSKRSSLPGLRSGLVAGDATLIAALRRFRSYIGPTMPLPLQAASAAVWRDEAHVIANRKRYAEKFDLAASLLAGRLGFYRPAGSFFLWLEVGDGEHAAQALWREAGVRVLPGGYLAAEATGGNPGHAFVRVALVDDLSTTEKGLAGIRRILAP